MPTKKRRRNRGWFRKGPDPRRSAYRFTASDCRVGYWVAALKHPELHDWLKLKIRCYYHNKAMNAAAADQAAAMEAANA